MLRHTQTSCSYSDNALGNVTVPLVALATLWSSVAVPQEVHFAPEERLDEKSGRGSFASLGPNFQIGRSTRVDHVLEVALRPI